MKREKGVDVAKVSFVLPELRCKVCSCVWFPRKSGEILNCPKCRSTDWNNGVHMKVKIPKITCPKCNHNWYPRDMDIKECVVCKKRLMNKRFKKGVKK